MARVEAAVLPLRPSWPHVQPRAWLARIVPTRRSLVVGLALIALALCGYAIARETSLFAIDRIEVQGGSHRLAGEVRQALGSLVGKPLVGLDGAAVVRDVDALPTVVRASYDRAFPHTLRVTIVPERPAAVLRSGAKSWLVSIRGRVMQSLSSAADPRLPRVWVSGHTTVAVGAILAAAQTRVAVRAVGLAGAFGSRVGTATYSGGTLVFHLRSGLQLLLGSPNDVKLKVAVATRALAMVPSGSTFLDVSVPGRTVSGTGSPALPAPQASS
ncbi:MAG TPA: FtsQ-type POTRA domain-containing protein, partial [Gaiellaceae bacterium]|nr:FtsQ-type POTRA domain-containing protein [Gaiellaceae bacterium]